MNEARKSIKFSLQPSSTMQRNNLEVSIPSGPEKHPEKTLSNAGYCCPLTVFHKIFEFLRS